MKFAPKKTTTEPDSTSSPATDTPPPETSADASTTAATESSTTGPAIRRTQVAFAAAAVIAASAVAGFALGNNSSAVQSNDALVANENLALAPAASAPDLVATALDSAESYHSVNSTYVGFTMPGVLVAASQSVFLVASSLDGICAFSKIVDSVRFEVGTDSTGETCTPATMETAQEMLDDLSSATELSATSSLGSSISAAAESAVLYASISFDASGRPSLYGLTDLQVPGTKVLSVARDGQSATVQVLADGLCSVVKVTATPSAAPAHEPC